MKKFATLILVIFASATAFAYEDLIKTIQLARLVKDTQNAREIQSTVREIKEFYALEKFADLKLWYLEQTRPKIFITIETADNATDIGYLRLDYRKAGTFGKLGLLKEYFNLN